MPAIPLHPAVNFPEPSNPLAEALARIRGLEQLVEELVQRDRDRQAQVDALKALTKNLDVLQDLVPTPGAMEELVTFAMRSAAQDDVDDLRKRVRIMERGEPSYARY